MATFKVIHRPGNYRDEASYSDVIHYCTNPNKTPSGLIQGCGVDPAHAAEQMEILAEVYGQNYGTRVRHSVISFSSEEGITPEEANEIAGETMDFYKETYQMLSAVHENTENVHIHFVMNRISYRDGSRYQGQKDDYYRFKRYLQRNMRKHGLNLHVAKMEENEALC